jgi:hypothetical protein
MGKHLADTTSHEDTYGASSYIHKDQHDVLLVARQTKTNQHRQTQNTHQDQVTSSHIISLACQTEQQSTSQNDPSKPIQPHQDSTGTSLRIETLCRMASRHICTLSQLTREHWQISYKLRKPRRCHMQRARVLPLTLRFSKSLQQITTVNHYSRS